MSEQQYDVNTPDGFAAAQRAAEERAGVPEFEEEARAVTEAPVEPEAPSEEDDRVAKLEKQLTDAQEMIGRQSNEIGELRREQDTWAAEEDQSAAMVTEETWEQIGEAYENKGGIGLMAQISHQQPQLIDAALSYWKAQGDPEAFLYEQQMRDLEAQIRDQQVADQGPDPTIEAIRIERAQEAAVQAVQREYGNERVAAAEPYFKQALDVAPATMKRAIEEDIQSGDQDRAAAGLKTLISLAETSLNPEVSKLAADQRAAANRTAKQAAAAHTGSRPEARAGDSDLPATEEELNALDPEARRAAAARIMGKRILEGETSVAAELAKSQPPMVHGQ